MSTHATTRIEILETRIAPATIFVVNDSNQLISFDSATPGTIIGTTNITGLTSATEIIKGIDFRPATGQLYALGINIVAGANNDEGRLYTLNTSTGAATAVSATPFVSTFADGDDFAFDFNPAVDRIRVETDRDDNLRVNPNTGALAGTDTSLTPNTAQIVGVSYDRNFDGTPATTLYGIDLNTDSLVTIGGINGSPSPNGGTISTVGSLGVDLGTNFKVGFDIESHTGTAFAAIRPNGGVTNLYTINLASGAATFVGVIGGNPSLNGLSVALPDDLTIVNPLTATYTDQDGDKVTVKISGAAAGAALSKADFTFASGQFGSQLRLLNFADDMQEWAKASITITAVPVAGKGDSFATIGYINATGVDLGKVTINGDLGQIDAGDMTTTTPGLVALTVHSLGVFSNSQLPTTATTPDQTSTIAGKLGALTVKTDMARALVTVTGGATDGAIGSVFVGGDIIGTGTGASSGIKSSGPIGNVKLLGSLIGGSSNQVGSIISGTTMGSVFVGGSIFGGTFSNTGIIESGTNMGNVIVKGSIFGGTDDHTGNVHSRSRMGNVTIYGSIISGVVVDPVNDMDSGLVYAFGTGDESIGAVKVFGNLQGGNSDFSGSVFASNTMKSATIGGFIKGGTGTQSGNIEAGNNMGPVKIGGDALGGAGFASGSIYTFSDGNIASVTIGGSLVGGDNTLTGILSGNQLGPVKIAGDLRAASAAGVRISAEATLTNNTAATSIAIKSLTVKGSVSNALILGGYTTNGGASNPDATIGPVLVGGNWSASSLIAGGDDGADNLFGTADDVKITEAVADLLFSKIASVTIKGYALGTVGGSDSFGIVAEKIGIVKVGLRPYLLAPGTDITGTALGTTNDFRVREI